MFNRVSLLHCPQIDAAEDSIMKPLERFRRENIGAAKVRLIIP